MLQVHSVRHVRNNAHATLETYAFSIDIWMQVRTEHLFSLVIRQHGYKSQKFGTPKHDVTKTLTEFTTCMVQAMGQVNGRWQLSTTPPAPKKILKRLIDFHDTWNIFYYLLTVSRMYKFKQLRRRGWSGQIASLPQKVSWFFHSLTYPQVISWTTPCKI